MKQYNNLKIALAHDFLLYPGGAEKVLQVLSEMFPEAPIFTLLYDQAGMKEMFRGKKIKTSYLQKFPQFLRQHHRWLLPFYPSAPETFDFRDYDLVISSSGAWTKGIVTKLSTKHIAYIHSPMRFVWEKHKIFNAFVNLFVRQFLSYLRLWDKMAAERPDHLIANSKYTQKRIQKYYRRESEVIYPPVESNNQETRDKKQTNNNNQISNFNNTKNYFLIVSRLSPYKKVDLAVEAFNKLELPLIIVGQGKEEKRLRKMAGKNVKILGWQSEEKLREYYAGARAFIFPAVDDFGMTMVEAMAHGVPVIALKKGGALEIVEEGITGEFFQAQTPEVLADAVRRFLSREKEFDREAIMKHASEFSKERFKMELTAFIEKVI